VGKKTKRGRGEGRILSEGQGREGSYGLEKIIWNFDNVQKAYATRGYEAKAMA
jgi:hypothetical protein